jgi:methylamine dehydrogenase light chain
MIGSLQRLVEGFDRLSEAATRLGAQRIGRRSALAGLGSAIAGSAILPMLPFDRSGGAAQAASTRDEGDETC